MARIATLCTDERGGTKLIDMAAIRWYRISAALARLGHEVDILHGRYKWRLRQPVHELAPGLSEAPLSRARWGDYDVVKVLFHRGFETLERFGGASHPFVISKLGSVVGPQDQEGIYFYGVQRERLFRVQERIQQSSRFVTVLTEPARELWRRAHGDKGNILLVPGAADAVIPSRGADPYPGGQGIRVIFAGNFYSTDRGSQAEAHHTLTDKLNRLGALLQEQGIHLYVLGPGEAQSLDPSSVSYLGAVPYGLSWQYLHWADVGLVVSAGAFMHNNESTKVYHYLRVGLPVVMESGFPNDHLVETTGHGHLVDAGDIASLRDAIVSAAATQWDRQAASDFILGKHTWDHRAAVYDTVITDVLGS